MGGTMGRGRSYILAGQTTQYYDDFQPINVKQTDDPDQAFITELLSEDQKWRRKNTDGEIGEAREFIT